MPASVVPHRAFQNQNLNEMGGSHTVLRWISGMITPECVSRIGFNWGPLVCCYQRIALSIILHSTVNAQNIDCYGEI